jgi:uncharacterized protein (DUF2384 family)
MQAEITLQREKDLSGPALRTFFNIAVRWQLTDGEQMNLLGSVPRSTFYKWKKLKAGLLSHDGLERISYILGIYKALHILFPQEDAADAWIKKPNKTILFKGQSALSRMLSGNVVDLYVVRQYLDAQRGGWV